MAEITPNLPILNQYQLMRMQDKQKQIKRIKLKEKLLKRKLRLKARKRAQAWLYSQFFQRTNQKLKLELARKLKKVV